MSCGSCCVSGKPDGEIDTVIVEPSPVGLVEASPAATLPPAIFAPEGLVEPAPAIKMEAAEEPAPKTEVAEEPAASPAEVPAASPAEEPAPTTETAQEPAPKTEAAEEPAPKTEAAEEPAPKTEASPTPTDPAFSSVTPTDPAKADAIKAEEADTEREPSVKKRPSLGSNPALYAFASPDEKENAQRPAAQEVSERGASVKSSIASLCNCCIGVGVLTMPLAFQKVGILAGMCLMVCCASLCFFTMVLMQEVMLSTKATTYGGCIQVALGNKLSRFTDVAIMVFMFGRLTAYCSVVTSLLLDLLVEFGLEGEPFGGGFMTIRRVLTLLIGGLVLFPLNIPDKIDALKHLSVAATCCMTFAICCITFRGLQRMIGTEGQPSFPCEGCAEPIVWDGFKIEFFNAFATYCFAYSTHGNMVVILSELKNPTRKRGIICFCGLIGYASCIYPVMANMGYGQFTDRTCSNIIQAYGEDTLLAVARVGVLICVTGGHPVNGFPLKVSTECLLFAKENRCPRNRKIIITVWCILSTLVAASGATIDSFVEIAGAFGGSATAFVLPAMAYSAIKTPGWTMGQRLKSKYAILSGACGLLVATLTVLVIMNTFKTPTVEASCENIPCCGDNYNRACCATA